MTEQPAERTDDFELSEAWQRVVTEVEQQRSLVSATVLVQARFVSVLQTQFGRHCEVGDTAGDGRVHVRLAAPTPLMIAQHLAGWGALLEVVESDPTPSRSATSTPS